MLVAFSLIFSILWARPQELPDLDTMSLFHEAELEFQVIEKFSLQSHDAQVNLEIYFINAQQEPFVEPIKIIVGYQIDGGEFKRVDRNFDGTGEKTYCYFSEPEIMTREEYAQLVGADLEKIKAGEPLSVPGEYLVIPVYKYAPEKGACDFTKVYEELIPIGGLKAS